MNNLENEPSIFSSCSGQIETCEVMRLSIFLQNSEQENTEVQGLRQRLARVACKECKLCYLPDVQASK